MYIHWNIDPVIFHVGPLSIRWYGVLFATSFLIGFKIIQWIYRREGRSEDELDSLFIYMFFGVLIGARLGHCLFYDPVYYLSHPVEILEIWEGGLASHGGAIGILTALYIYTRKSGRPSYLWLLDRIVLPVALAGSFIRIGNFFNSEILGLPTTRSWAVVFDRVDAVPRHPVQLYEALAYAIIFVVLVLMYRRSGNAEKKGLLLGVFLILVFFARFLLEFLKTRQEAVYEANLILSVGQWLSIPFVLLGIWLVARAVRKP